jgi:hypothetical protein
LDFAERDECKPVLLSLLAGNLVKPLLSLYGTEWRERGYASMHPGDLTEINEYAIFMKYMKYMYMTH